MHPLICPCKMYLLQVSVWPKTQWLFDVTLNNASQHFYSNLLWCIMYLVTSWMWWPVILLVISSSSIITLLTILTFCYIITNNQWYCTNVCYNKVVCTYYVCLELMFIPIPMLCNSTDILRTGTNVAKSLVLTLNACVAIKFAKLWRADDHWE